MHEQTIRCLMHRAAEEKSQNKITERFGLYLKGNKKRSKASKQENYMI